MDTRLALQILLGVIVVACLGLGGFIVYSLTREAETVVVKRVVTKEAVADKEIINPWAEKTDLAIKLVQNARVKVPKSVQDLLAADEAGAVDEAKNKKKRRASEGAEVDKPEDDIEMSIGDLLDKEAFVRRKLKIDEGKKLVGWTAQWWGETKYGPTFFLVRYGFKDENITVGPAWLVDLNAPKLVPKNVLARVTTNPRKGTTSPYYDKESQVVKAITNHRFESGVNLGGALLLYFERRDDADTKDTILGWTIDHDRKQLFKAYFQWVEGKEPTYAEFEFDYDRKALKAVNLQAANMMRIGEDFERTERVDIMPQSYDPKESNPRKRWQGKTRKACKSPKFRSRCKAMATVFLERELIESLEWLLTAQANTAEAFEDCKADRKCSWQANPKDEGTYRVDYHYNLTGKDNTISWEVKLKGGKITPADRRSVLAYRAINPR